MSYSFSVTVCTSVWSIWSVSSVPSVGLFVKGFLQFGPASHLQNIVHPMDLHLQLSPLHSETSGASLVPGGTVRGTTIELLAVALVS